MKTAIVLAGGGSKGSYQAGVWKALRELGVEYQIVTGTSIGAVNGALMVMGDYERAERLWHTVTVEDIMAHGMNLKHDMDYYFENRDQLLQFAKEFAASRGADITPYRELVHREFDEKLFLKSHVDYAAVTAKFPSMQMVEARKSEMTPGAIEQWLIASSSCFPVFPLCEIDGQSYIDGGYADNLPISTAFRLGAEQVVAVALKPDAFEKNYPHHPLVKRIVPSRPLGPFLDFSPGILQKNFCLGYVDALRAYGRCFGEHYAFSPLGVERLLDAARAYLLWLLRWELCFDGSGVQSMLDRFTKETRLSDQIFSHAHGDLLSASVAGLETLMELLGYAHEEIYEIDELLPELRDRLLADSDVPELKQAAAFAETLCRGDWRGLLLQHAPGKSDVELLLATLRLYFGMTEDAALTV